MSVVDGGCDIYIAEFDPALSTVGVARQVTKQGFYSIGAVAWSRDGMFLVYEQRGTFISYLWRVTVDGRRDPERIEAAGINARSPALADRADQLAFAHVTSDVDVYALDSGGSRRLALSSTYPDFQAQFSPDRSRIVFCSARSGNAIEIWMAAGDGSDAHRLLTGPNLRQGSPHWSPDGRWIAFDSQSADGHWHVWLVDADGGTPRQVTTAPGNQNLPTWSRDGGWIYFSARGESPRRLYRVRPTGEQIEPVTETPAVFGMESGDGQSVVFQPPGLTAPLLIRPPGGAPVRTLVPCVPSTAFSASSRGIFYVTCGSDRPAVRWLDPKTGADRVIGTAAQWARGVPARSRRLA